MNGMKGRVLIVDDDTALAEMLGIVLRGEGFETAAVSDGDRAFGAFREFKPDLVLLDLMLPGRDGIDVCRQIRAESGVPIVMLTAKSDTVDVVVGLESGADDYVIKPFKPAELKARAQVGMRMVALQESMARRLAELEQALANVKQLRGLLPMCAYCKKIRVDDKYWQQLESYLADHSDAEFSHGICPECFPSVLDEVRNHKHDLPN